MKLTIKFFAIAFLLLSVASLKADSPQAAVESLASKHLLAVGYVDLDSIEVESCLEWVVQQDLVPAYVASEMSLMTGMAQGFLQQATKAGADHVIALVHQDDLKLKGPPLFVVSIADGHEAKKTIKSLRRILGLLQIPNFEMEVWNNSILAGTAEQIARAKAEPLIERPSFVKAWQKLGGHDAGAIILGNRDTRRVVRELFPKLDSPFENVTGSMIADNLISGGFSINFPDEIGAKIVVQATDDDSAEAVSNAFVQLRKMLVARQSEFSGMASAIGIAAMAEVEPEVVGNDVVLDLCPLLKDKVRLASILEPFLASSRKAQRCSDLRQIVIAMLNYESTNKSWPAYANFDSDGKPLLSWRVHILPFLDEGEVYKKFKLDEPWNSPHNIKLVTEMPEPYADPSRNLDHLNRSGMTRVVVPFGEGTMFCGAEGVKSRMIMDGSSNTLAVANVPPNKAVVWTQPTDWNVDLEDPKKGLFDNENKEAVVARANGAAYVLSSELPVKKLKELLTKDGGESP